MNSALPRMRQPVAFEAARNSMSGVWPMASMTLAAMVMKADSWCGSWSGKHRSFPSRKRRSASNAKLAPWRALSPGGRMRMDGFS